MKIQLIRILQIAALSLACAAARAQDATTYYTVQHPKQFKIDWGAFYRDADARTAAVRAQLPHELDIPYGDNIKQRLDLYMPTKKVSKAPVFLFLHGGGFREGDRAQYGYVAKPFAAKGVITAVASYRLTGDGFKYPDEPEDARRAFEWLYRHIAQYGGDPTRIYVGGHSAGAILAADLGVDRKWLAKAGIPANVLRGIAPISAPYDLRTRGRAGEDDVYAPTADLQERASPLLHIADPAPAAVIALGAEETASNYMSSSKDLAQKLKDAGVHVQFLSIAGADHRATVQTLGDENSELFHAVDAMINAR